MVTDILYISKLILLEDNIARYPLNAPDGNFWKCLKLRNCSIFREVQRELRELNEENCGHERSCRNGTPKVHDCLQLLRILMQ